MNVKVIDKDVLDTLKICHQVIDLGMSYQQVADNMHISAPTVGRRLEKAKKVGWVKEQISFDIPEEYREIRNYIFSADPDLENELLRVFSGKVHTVQIVASAGGREGLDTSRQNVAAAGAYFFEELWKSGAPSIVGVNWGRSLLAFSNSLRLYPNRELVIVPLFGDSGLHWTHPRHQEAAKYHSTRITHLISQKFSASEPIRLTFQALIPAKFAQSKSTRDAIKQYIESDPSYQAVYGTGGLIDQVDTVITGIGALDREGSWFNYIAYLDQADPESEFHRLSELGVVGDIAQHFVTKEGVVKKTHPAIDSINRRVIGIRPEHFIRVAERYRGQKSIAGAGVITIAAGRHKARVIVSAVQSKAVNHLIIDKDLAVEIKRLLNSDKE